jgi:hypothetical protein
MDDDYDCMSGGLAEFDQGTRSLGCSTYDCYSSALKPNYFSEAERATTGDATGLLGRRGTALHPPGGISWW